MNWDFGGGRSVLFTLVRFRRADGVGGERDPEHMRVTSQLPGPAQSAGSASESSRCCASPSPYRGPEGRLELVLAAQQFAAGDNTRRLHLGSLRSPSVRLAGVAPELNAVRRLRKPKKRAGSVPRFRHL